MTNSRNATESLDKAIRRRQNLRLAATAAGLLALVALCNLTPVRAQLCAYFDLEDEIPASLLGNAYWDDCFGGPLGTLAAGSLPRPNDLSYSPEADAFLAALNEFAAREVVQQEAAPESEPNDTSDSAAEEAANPIEGEQSSPS